MNPLPWSTPKKVAAYAILSVLALVAIYLVDHKARQFEASPQQATTESSAE